MKLALFAALLLGAAWWLRRKPEAIPPGQSENIELLRRLDAWDESKSPGPLIRWAAAHLRGCIAVPWREGDDGLPPVDIGIPWPGISATNSLRWEAGDPTFGEPVRR